MAIVFVKSERGRPLKSHGGASASGWGASGGLAPELNDKMYLAGSLCRWSTSAVSHWDQYKPFSLPVMLRSVSVSQGGQAASPERSAEALGDSRWPGTPAVCEAGRATVPDTQPSAERGTYPLVYP